MFKKIDRNYVSDADNFLQNFDETHPEKTASQQQEINKHQRIGNLRDGVVKTKLDDADASDKEIWEGF